jgi:hypothetical protein
VRRADSSPSCSPSCKYSCIGCATLVPHCDRSEPSHTRTHARTHTYGAHHRAKSFRLLPIGAAGQCRPVHCLGRPSRVAFLRRSRCS